MRLAARLAARAGGLVLTLLALAGCGGSSDNGVSEKLPNEILVAAATAAQDASSVHVVSETSQGPLKTSVDLVLSKDAARGKISFLGADYEVVRLGQTVYVKGGGAFAASLSARLGKHVHVPANAWLKGSAGSGPLAQVADVTKMSGELERLLSASGPTSKGSKTTVKGQHAIVLKEKTRLFEANLYVATTGKPYPIEQVKNGGRERGRTSYSEWDEPVLLKAPSRAVAVGSSPAGGS